jgi:hypothetical protein
VLELLLRNGSPELCNDDVAVTGTLLPQKIRDRRAKFCESIFLTERVEVLCIVGCDVGRGMNMTSGNKRNFSAKI